LINKLP